MQTWMIKGKRYTHGQLMELKKQGLDPRKDIITLGSVTPRKEKPEVPKVVREVKKVKPVEPSKKPEEKMGLVKPEEEKTELVEEKHTVIVTEEMLVEYPELAEQGLKVGDEMDVEDEAEVKEPEQVEPQESEAEEKEEDPQEKPKKRGRPAKKK